MTKPNGFTIVDLLVVVLILLVAVPLMVILYGMLCCRATEQANRAVCGTRLRILDTACKLYADDYLGKYPVGWRHADDGTGEWTTGGQVTPEDSFALLVHKDLVTLAGLICPTQGGRPPTNEWELVGIGGAYDGDPAAAAEEYIHYAYQDVGVGDGKNYFAGSELEEDCPVLADRGMRKDARHGNYELNGKGSANHIMWRGCQNVVRADRSVNKVYTNSDGTCLVGYSNGELGDNIYTDKVGENDTYLLSSEAQTGSSSSK